MSTETPSPNSSQELVESLVSQPSTTTKESTKKARGRKYGQYVKKGFYWNLKAREISALAVVVSDYLWYRQALNQGHTITVTQSDLGLWTLRKADCQRIFLEMARKGLITLQEEQDGWPMITIVPHPMDVGKAG